MWAESTNCKLLVEDLLDFDLRLSVKWVDLYAYCIDGSIGVVHLSQSVAYALFKLLARELQTSIEELVHKVVEAQIVLLEVQRFIASCTYIFVDICH